MITSEDIKRLILQGESLNLEMKKCKKDSLPDSIRETYSAFANTHGGVILLGIDEDKSKPQPDRFSIVGVGDSDKLVTDLFNMLHNPQKVNRCVLMDSDVRPIEMDGVWLTLPLPQQNVGDNVGENPENVTNGSENVTDSPENVTDSPENVTDSSENVTNSSENVTKTAKRRTSILEIMKSNSYATTEEIAKMLKVSKRTILRDIEYLTNSNVIKREGGSFGGKWIINV